MTTVLFMCVHNAGRSQMAAAFLRRATTNIEVLSAGSEPAGSVNTNVAAAMLEVGIDLSAEIPKLFDIEMAKTSDVVITMGCGDACPVLPGKRYLDWTLPDPAGKSLDQIRPIRDEIRQRVESFIEELNNTHK